MKSDLIKSEGYLKTSLELDGSNLGSLNLQGLVKTKLGKDAEAISCFNEILKINSNDINALNNLGNLYRKKGEHNDSLLLINKALEIDPENINLLINKTSSLISAGMFQEAKELSYTLLKKNKNNSILLNNLGIINGYFNNYDDKIKISFVIQDEYKGTADATYCAKNFVKDDPFLLYLSDTLIPFEINSLIKKMIKVNEISILSSDNFANISISVGNILVKNDYLHQISEKSDKLISKLAWAGVAYFNNSSIFNFIENLSLSPRGEYDITEAMNLMLIIAIH